MKLTIDIGNTRIKWGVFDEDEMVHYEVFTQDYDARLNSVFDQYDIKSSISSSTRQHASSMESKVGKYTDHIILDHHTPIPIKNSYSTPETLGRDRLAGVIAGHSINKNKTCIVIDAGTCITYDVVTAAGEYVGGNIAPGVRMRLEAMHHFTDGLPLVDMVMPELIIGNSTETALQNGAVRGTKMEIESFLATMSDKFDEFSVILTGGDAIFFGELLNTEIFVCPNLILIGLNEILKYNA